MVNILYINFIYINKNECIYAHNFQTTASNRTIIFFYHWYCSEQGLYKEILLIKSILTWKKQYWYEVRRLSYLNINIVLAGTQTRQQKKKISKNKQQQDFTSSETNTQSQVAETDTKSKKKTKYVNLYSQEGKNAQVVLLKGT